MYAFSFLFRCANAALKLALSVGRSVGNDPYGAPLWPSFLLFLHFIHLIPFPSSVTWILFCSVLSAIRILELEELIGTPAFKLYPAIKVERPVNIPIPKVCQSENGETGAGDKETAGKKRKVSSSFIWLSSLNVVVVGWFFWWISCD